MSDQHTVSRRDPTVETLLIGGAGATFLVLLGVPAGAVLGALLATAAASLAGRTLGWPAYVRKGLYVLLGYGAGASVTPAALAAALLWPLSLVALVVTALAMWAVGWLVFRHLSPTDGRTAFYAASPGALGTVLLLAEQHQMMLEPRGAVRMAWIGSAIHRPGPRLAPLIEQLCAMVDEARAAVRAQVSVRTLR